MINFRNKKLYKEIICKSNHYAENFTLIQCHMSLYILYVNYISIKPLKKKGNNHIYYLA